MTPEVWSHIWRPIQFVLIVNDFGAEYVGKNHANHLITVLNKHYKMSEDWEGKSFAGINLAWNYAPRHQDCSCCLSMDSYVKDLLLKEGHKLSSKLQYSPHKQW